MIASLSRNCCKHADASAGRGDAFPIRAPDLAHA